MRVRYGGGVQSGGDQAGEVGHVDHQVGTHLVGDATELGEVELPRIGRPSGQDQLGPALPGQSLDLVPCRPGGRLGDVVRGNVVELAGEVELHPVGEMAAVGAAPGPGSCRPGEAARAITAALACAPGMRLHVGVGRPRRDS